VFTTVSAVLLQVPDLAVGDLLGAVMTNMLTLGVIELFHHQKRVWQQTAYEHTLIAALAMVLTGLAGLFILIRASVTLWGVGIGSLIALIYILGMRVVYRQEDIRRRQRERERVLEAEEEGHVPTKSRKLRRASVGFAIATLTIAVAAPSLATSAKAIAEMTGIGTMFIGTFLVAVMTSLTRDFACGCAARGV
jgi:cation:H+ antiporter